MKEYLLFTLIAAITLTVACDTGGTKKTPVAEYEYVVYKDESGAVPAPGDQVYFQMDILDDKDSLMQSYRNQKVMPSIKMVEAADPMRKKNAIVDVLSIMSIGDSVGLHVPIDSIPNMPPGFEELAFLEYRLVTKEILTGEEFEKRMMEEQEAARADAERLQAMRPQIEELARKTIKEYKRNSLDLKETAEGVKYVIHELGTGEMPTNDRMVSMLYYGMTVEGETYFDDSFSRGQPYPFRLGRGSVIRGWDESIPYFPVGTKASIFIPPAMGYGEAGSPPDIPPNAELYFYLEVDEMFY